MGDGARARARWLGYHRHKAITRAIRTIYGLLKPARGQQRARCYNERTRTGAFTYARTAVAQRGLGLHEGRRARTNIGTIVLARETDAGPADTPKTHDAKMQAGSECGQHTRPTFSSVQAEARRAVPKGLLHRDDGRIKIHTRTMVPGWGPTSLAQLGCLHV